MMQGPIYFLQPYWFGGLMIPLLWLRWSRHRILRWPELIPPLRVRFPVLGAIHTTAAQPAGAGSSANLWFALFQALLVISLAQPVRYSHSLPAETEADAVDLILVVNTSVSMVLKDNIIEGKQLDRMQMTRHLLQQLVEKFQGRRIALVLLGRPPSIWLPLTRDRKLLQQAIARLQTTLGGRSSDIGETLDLVRKEFAIPAQEQADRVVLLISDGDQQLGAVAPEVAVKKLVADGFQLHTLAIGSATKPPLSLGKGHLIYTPVDLNLMTALARTGKGLMVHGLDDSSVQKLLDILAKPAPYTADMNDRKLVNPLYHYPLILAMLVLLSILLPFSELTAAVTKGPV